MPQQTIETTLEATVEIGHFRQFIDGLNSICDEAKLRIDEDGLSSRAVDPANVAMVEAELPEVAFTEYDCDDETAIGVNLNRIRRILERLEGEGQIKISLNEQYRKLAIEVGDYSYTYAYIDPEAIRGEPDIPEMELNAGVEIESDRLHNALSFFKTFANRVTVGYDLEPNEFYIEGMEDGGTDDGEFRVFRDNLVEVFDFGDARSVYSVDYFHDITDALPEGGTVRLRVGEEFPMFLSYGIAHEDGLELGEVRMMQAPRIQTD